MAPGMNGSLRDWIGTGSPWVWLTAGAVSLNLVMVLGLLYLIAARGLTQFWPHHVQAFTYADPDAGNVPVLGRWVDSERVHRSVVEANAGHVPPGLEWVTRRLYKVGNRDVSGADFAWYDEHLISGLEEPSGVLVVEREEWGNMYGYLAAVHEGDREVATGAPAWTELKDRLERRHEFAGRIEEIEKDRIGAVNYALEQLRLEERALARAGRDAGEARERIAAERAARERDYENLGAELAALNEAMARDTLVVRIADGSERRVPLSKIVRVFRPNDMGFVERCAHYLAKAGEFVFDDPREANTEGGIFPAIFGTVMMVLIMSLFVTPFGVVTAVYMHEYARQGTFTRIIRVAVNNLAGVPSVVYGVFGLGFFVYFVGGGIDRLFYPDALPAPTFGTPGLLWSSLTLAILTVPVVIVATEEGLSRIPRAIREGSLALGATKAETLFRTVLPMATPAMMTGLILAIARAAGEVAPLMLVGVVKLAPTLPLDGNFPFLHLDRKFMHLGFHIYDVGFQSPNVEAARPLVYATSMLLVTIIVALNLAAIRIRNRLREKYNASET